MNYYTFKTMVMQTKYELNIIHFNIYCVNKRFFQNLYCHTVVPSIDDNNKKFCEQIKLFINTIY